MSWPLYPGQYQSSPVSRRSKHDHQRPLRRTWHQQRYQACNWHQRPLRRTWHQQRYQACNWHQQPHQACNWHRQPTRAVAYRDDERRHARETKPSFKTTELIVYVLSVLGVLIASWVVDVNDDGQRFSAYQGWFLVTLLTIGYLISRGLAKSGSRDETR